MDDDGGASDIVYALFRNGSTIATASAATLDADLAFTGAVSTWTIPAGFNTSNVVDAVIDSDGGGDAAIFFRNLSYVVAAGVQAPPFSFTTIMGYTLPTGFSSSDAVGVDVDRTAGPPDIAMLFKNGSYAFDGSQADFTTDIAFAGVSAAAYQSNINLTVNSTINLSVRLSNNTVAWTPWRDYSSKYGDTQLIDNVWRYVQYRTYFFSPDMYKTPRLENVSINYTESNAPRADFVLPTPANSSFIKDDYAFVNVSIIDEHSTDNWVLEFDGLNTSMLIQRDGRNATCYLNKTSVAEGAHYFRAYVNDTFGNMNISLIRNITVDLTAPTITFVSQTPSIVHNHNNVTLIVSITDNYFLNNTFVETNASNQFTNDTLNPPVGSNFNITIVSQNLSSREFVYYRFYANDTAGNMYITGWFNFSVVPAIANVSLVNPLYETNRYVNETLFINATLTAINGTIRNCLVNISNQTGLVVIGDTNRTIGSLTNGTTSQVVGWELNGTLAGFYTVNITSNCSEGDPSLVISPLIEIISQLTNFSDTLYIEKRSIDGSSYFHSTTDTAVHWWLNISTYEEFITLDSARPGSSWFTAKWFILVNNSIQLDFSNFTWDQQRAGINNETNSTFLQFTGRALGSTLKVNITKVLYPHSNADNISFTVENIGTTNFSDIKLKLVMGKFNIHNDSHTDTLLLTNATTQTENYTMDSSTSLQYNLTRFNGTKVFFKDNDGLTQGQLYFDMNMSANGVKTALHNFTFQAGGTPFSVNLTFSLGDLNVSTIKSLDPGAGLLAPGSIRRTGAITTMNASENGTTYTDVTIPLTDNNFGTRDYIEARTGDTAIVLNIVNNTEMSSFDQVFLRVRMDSTEESPYPTFVFAYNPNNVTVMQTPYNNRTFVTWDANTWVSINITEVAHLQDNFGYIRVRLDPNASTIGNNKRLYFDEIQFNVTDMTPPRITLVSPVEDYNTTSDTILFNFTVSDKVDMNITCNVTLDGIVNQSLLNITNGTSFNFTKVNLSAGQHYWNVTCWDEYSNINTSLTRNFTIVRGPQAISINLTADNDTIDLMWEALGYVDFYNIHIIDQFTDEYSATPNRTTYDANYTDRNAANRTTRFYRVYGVKGSANHTTNKTVGKYE